MTSLHAGHDVRHFTEGAGAGGCAGAMSYYTAVGEPPGQWAGKAAAKLDLTGRVDAAVIERLYMRNTSPDGEVLAPTAKGKKAEEREAEAAAAYLAKYPYASPGEVAEAKAAARGNEPRSVPYFDFTISAAKSVSVLHASLRVSAVQARQRGDEDLAADLDSRAQAIEGALMETAREVVGWLERHAAYTRTGHHSATTGSGVMREAWSPPCSCTTFPVTVTRSCMCTFPCGTGSSAPSAPRSPRPRPHTSPTRAAPNSRPCAASPCTAWVGDRTQGAA